MTYSFFPSVRNASRNLSSLLALTAVVGFAGCLIGVVPARAERRDTAKDDATYTLKRVYKTGETDRYRMTTKVNAEIPGAGPLDISTTMLMKELTKEAKEDGSLTSISEFESAFVNFNGMDVDITGMMPKVIMTRDKNGKSDVKMEGGNEQITSQIGDQLKQFNMSAAAAMLPSKAVKVGDSWEFATNALGATDQKTAGKVTLVSVDIIKGKKVAKLKTVSDVTGGADTKIHTEATTLIDVETGKAINTTTKTDGNANGSPINIEMSMKLLGPDDKDGAKEVIKAESNAKKP